MERSICHRGDLEKWAKLVPQTFVIDFCDDGAEGVSQVSIWRPTVAFDC